MIQLKRLGENFDVSLLNCTLGENLSRHQHCTYVLLMAEFQQVIYFSVNDHVLRSRLLSAQSSKISGHANGLLARLSPLITLKEDSGIMNLSVGLPADLEMFVWRDTSLFAAPVRQTELQWHWNSLRTNTARSWFHQESRPSSRRFLPVPDDPYPATCVRRHR